MKLQYKLFIFFVIVIVVFGATTIVSTSSILKKGLEHRLIVREKIGLEILESRIFPYLANKDYVTVTSILFEEIYIKKESVYYIVVYDKNNNILAHTFLNEIPEQVKQHVYNSGEDFYTHELSINNIPVIEITTMIKEGVYEVGYLSVGYKKEYIEYIESEIIGAIIYILIILTFSSIVFSFFLSKFTVQPIKELARGMEEVSKGNLDLKIEIKSKDEIGDLAESFKKMTRDLRKTTVSKDYVDNIIRSMYGTIVVVTPEGEIQTVNQATCDMLGYRAEELIGQPIDVLFAKDPQFKGSWLDELIEKDTLTDIEINYLAKDGRRIPMLFSGSVMRHKSGNIQGIVCVALDITERKRAEEEILLLLSLIQAISESKDLNTALEIALKKVCEATDWDYGEAWIPSSDGTTLELSPVWYSSTKGLEKFRRLSEGFTFPPGTGLPGRVWASKQHEWIPDVTTSPETVFPRVRFAKEGGLKASLGIPIITRDRVQAVLLFFMLKSREMDKRLVEIVTAVAAQLGTVIQRKRAEEEIRNLNRELGQHIIELKEANKELEAFSYSVSHDLRAPLRAIDGFSNVLLEDYENKLDDDGKRVLKIIRRNTHRMGELIDDLLTLSRLGRRDMAISGIDMDELAKAVIEELSTTAPGRVLQFNIKTLPFAYGDSGMIRQVFVDLLSNAIKFTRPRETAVIEVGGYTDKETNENVYYIKDNGVGFDMQYSNKLFGVFQRLHSDSEIEGTGVGLAIVWRIIHRHGGRTWAYGKVNEGATFYFTLPIKEMTV